MYFSKQGPIYLLQETKSITEHQKEALERGENIISISAKKNLIYVTWENSNTNTELVKAEEQPYYQSFGDASYKSLCYKRIIYKNVYNNIDIEYVFTNKKIKGIKYNVIAHPGANLNDIKIKYSGDLKKLVLKDGNVIVKNSVHDFIELAPKSYQNGLEIESNFNVENNTISFKLQNGYDSNKDLMIDPWVINLTLKNNNYGYDVDYDNDGNYYVFGGSGPFLISKYSNTGALQWTFAGVVPSIGWTSSGNLSPFAGNFVVDKLS